MHANTALCSLFLLQENKNFDLFHIMTHLAVPYILGLKIADQRAENLCTFTVLWHIVFRKCFLLQFFVTTRIVENR